MEESGAQNQKRILELARRSYDRGIFEFTDFLGLSEQSDFFDAMKKEPYPYTLFGGTEGTERVMARFGDAEGLGYEVPFPITPLRILPKSPKYAEALTHRDVLGALMNLGIERRLIGDILCLPAEYFVFCHADISDHILRTLTRIRHTDVTAEITQEVPRDVLIRTEDVRVQVTSERLDAVIAHLYGMSREDSQSLFPKKLVFIDGRVCTDTDRTPPVGAVVSVRGYGRFRYLGFESLSKKGKCNVTVQKYV